ncbi:DUF3800 domain-containing protein [Pseudoalteromonas sp. SWXJ133]|uniref:DUF3800 domain-containing protein n=1 Tax=Pseudoalteromonas sp. SWXJ133 TaxID=2792069 RepID=UPI0018CEDD8B|nr:DUF3800 domain-containing protein [Pseudoalteromonas sp. SWXJ133]MBH0022240.1 DUF3800 domain-containing protein [Pseudoalteromonas sp. SWXJ133]
MKYTYYLDESGNSGDLIGNKMNLAFGNQPIFTLSCIGISDLKKTIRFVSELRTKHDINDDELKSSELYFTKPEAILDLAKFISNERLPILVELVEKKYCIATNIVNHHIMPPYYMPDESDGKAQYIRNGLADYIANNLTDDCYESFFYACNNPSEENLLSSMNDLKNFFNIKKDVSNFYELTGKSIDETIDDYNVMKSRVGSELAIKKFLPLPDTTKKGINIKLLPHVHSIFNIIGRLNKYHCKELSNVTLLHDVQNDFDSILIYCKEFLENENLSGNGPPVLNSDYEVTEKLTLEFVDSEKNVGVQIADLLAGFFNRYINGLLYKNVDVDNVYHEIFSEFKKNFKYGSPLGVNFVIPESKQKIIFSRFNF